MKLSQIILKYRFVIVSIAFAAVLVVAIVSIFSVDQSTNKMVVEYVESLGWEVEKTPSEISHLTVPKSFDAVYETYNAVQKHSGFDLGDFKGKKITRYTYRVLNHKESKGSKVMLSIFVYEDNIVGADISSAEENGFMHAITETSNIAD